ncbi:hypothetical protein PLICRDRAFT_51762 [Plicaturopsis crispa FD-325 SS-3]|nr:hypothetical protein PLICRDRAFT_51762 [Plicaturopsis crispa FD-325 SS-3]
MVILPTLTPNRPNSPFVMSEVSYSAPSIPATPSTDAMARDVADVRLPEPPSYHSEFYIQNGMNEFLVENQLFRVHSYFLVRESEKLRSIIMRPREASDSAIPLPGVTVTEFESLMSFFHHGMHSDYDPSLDEWTALLSIASHFGMASLRERAIAEIDDFSEGVEPVDKILLARKYGVEAWLAPAYVALCRRENALDEGEGERLGMDTTVKLFRAREIWREARQHPVAASVPVAYRGFGAVAAAPADPGTAADEERERVLDIVNSVFYPVKETDAVAQPGSTVDAAKKGKKKGKKGKK